MPIHGGIVICWHSHKKKILVVNQNCVETTIKKTKIFTTNNDQSLIKVSKMSITIILTITIIFVEQIKVQFLGI